MVSLEAKPLKHAQSKKINKSCFTYHVWLNADAHNK